MALKLISHEPFKSREDCVTRDDDILSKTEILESLPEPQKVADSDIGRELQTQIDGLKQLLAAYRSGTIKEAISVPDLAVSREPVIHLQ